MEERDIYKERWDSSNNVLDSQYENPFLQIEIGKSLGNLASMSIFHDYDHIGPYKLLFGDRSVAIEAGGFSLEPVFEKLYSCSASVFRLIADEEDVHGIG